MQVPSSGYLGVMELTTITDFDAMTPAERDAAFGASITTPEALTERQRAALDSQDSEVRQQARRAS